MSVLVHQQGAVRTVTVNRPEQHNALDAETMAELGQAFADAEADACVAAVVLTGAGERSFCAGLDLMSFATRGLAADGPGLDVLLTRTYPKPIVAAVNGRALGVGFELVLACDLAVAADHATFALPEVTRGLVAAGAGISELPRRIPLAIALELGLTGAPIDAARAYGLGLVNRVAPGHDTFDAAHRLAETIAANAPLAVQFTKRHMYAAADHDADHRNRMREGLPEILASDDAREGARAFAERRPPSWTGR
ncbi:enoyl-CoA hydratase-related protein [Gordonia hankookensis]|uniref:Enoyl-CoA hydratase/isomerase family protein n=1 Tax=Gordonia hankookensis TaxID=589403 RepID=A0ABR7WCB0_9ACTN|nr:enoyl-CoA hydratase-related protein [Gordonia hankookensis]MBD1319364.1 enoyl-CoA hydratase/isomerase family protein [Gordonia hankookensis]